MSLDNHSNLREDLQKSWTHVKFTKKDGTLREMKCTTNLELIPVESHPKKREEVVVEQDTNFEVEVKVDENPLYNVYEEGKGWRSFRQNQIVSYNETILA